MAPDIRVIRARNWLRSGQRSRDSFDRFTRFWIALSIAAQELRGNYPGRYPDSDTDREKIKDYFAYHLGNVSEALDNHKANMTALSRRRGSRYRNPIADTGNDELRAKFRAISQHYLQGISLDPESRVEIFAEILNKVRNNLFHGGKDYDDQGDKELLDCLNPILLGILQKTLA